MLTVLTAQTADAHDVTDDNTITDIQDQPVIEAEAEQPVVMDPGIAARLACIARVESHNDPNATNRYSKAAGLYQFLWSTWATTPQGRAGMSPYDPVAATAAAEWMIRNGRAREWVAVSGGSC
jgi:hypothetical protein